MLPYRVAVAGTDAPQSALLTAAEYDVTEGVRQAGMTPLATDELAIRLARVAYSPDAQADRASARSRLDAAYREWFALDLKDAAADLEAAANAAARTPQEPQDLLLYSDLTLLKGMIALAGGKDPDGADDEFDLVARLTPNRTLDPRLFSPPIITALDKAKERRRNLPVAQVDFQTEPAGATVAIDGVTRGTTPLSIDRIEAGDHFYRVERAGSQPLFGPFHLDAGENPPIWKSLDAARADDLAGALRPLVAGSASTLASSLPKLFDADRVILVRLAGAGPRRYSVELWSARGDGTATAPLVRTLPAEPDQLARGLVAATKELLVAPAADGARPGAPLAPLPDEVASLVLGTAGHSLAPPPRAWWQKNGVRAGIGAGAVVLVLGAIVLAASQPGRVNVDVTVPPHGANP